MKTNMLVTIMLMGFLLTAGCLQLSKNLPLLRSNGNVPIEDVGAPETIDLQTEERVLEIDTEPNVTLKADPSEKTVLADLSLKSAESEKIDCPSGYEYSDGACKKEEEEHACHGQTFQNIYYKSSVRYVKGDYETTMTDHCMNDNMVYEYYCDGKSVLVDTLSCPSGYSCSDGACVRTSTCSGSSSYGSVYQKTYRFVYKNSRSYEYSDYCMDSSTVYKAYCNGDTVSYGAVSCPSGYSCSNGACVKTSTCSGPSSWSYYSQNTVRYTNGGYIATYFDYCRDSYTATKYYCSGDRLISTAVACPSGYVCRSGGICSKSTNSGCSSGSCGSTSSSSSGSSGCSSGSCGSSSSGTSGSSCSSGSCGTSSSSSSSGCSGGSCPANKAPATSGSSDLVISDELMDEFSNNYAGAHVDYNYAKWMNVTMNS